MRVAVCVSGACRAKGSLTRNIERLKSKFRGADFYYATWDSYQDAFRSAFLDEECRIFPEPRSHYHPYFDIDPEHHVSGWYRKTVEWVKSGGKDRREWTSHHVKQILIHAWLADAIKANYDVLVRTRFDAFVSRCANFGPYLEDTYSSGRANCFGTTRPDGFDQVFEVDIAPGSLHSHWTLDHIIIHRADAIDRERIDALYRDKKLHAAEYGWHQVLGGNGHRNHSGWVNPDHAVLDKFLCGA